ncbi:unnamed protein product [Effrenium voratum]|nr:unnamed protein product [Effrenium voratum]
MSEKLLPSEATMGCVRRVSGEYIMTQNEFALWDEIQKSHSDRENHSFVDVLRGELARRMQLRNFRRLVLAHKQAVLGPQTPWMDVELVAIVRPYESESAAGLLQAAGNGDIGIVLKCLERPLDPDACDDEGFTALHWAVDGSYMEIVCCLLEAGADTNRASKDEHFTPLHGAVINGSQEAASCLLEAGADTEQMTVSGETPMLLASFLGNQHAIQCLLEARADTQRTDLRGCTPLHIAANRGYLECVQSLLEAGADKDTTDHKGRVPLHGAAESGCPKTVHCLLEARADKDAVDVRLRSPLHFAAIFGHHDVTRRLLDSGAEKDSADWRGQTPAEVAARFGHLRVVHCLADGGRLQAVHPMKRRRTEVGTRPHRTAGLRFGVQASKGVAEDA